MFKWCTYLLGGIITRWRFVWCTIGKRYAFCCIFRHEITDIDKGLNCGMVTVERCWEVSILIILGEVGSGLHGLANQELLGKAHECGSAAAIH